MKNMLQHYTIYSYLWQTKCIYEEREITHHIDGTSETPMTRNRMKWVVKFTVVYIILWFYPSVSYSNAGRFVSFVHFLPFWGDFTYFALCVPYFLSIEKFPSTPWSFFAVCIVYVYRYLAVVYCEHVYLWQ